MPGYSGTPLVRKLGLKPFADWVYGLAVSPDGRTLVAGGERTCSRHEVDFIPVSTLGGK